MSEETIRTVISCGTTVLVALISNILMFALTKHSNNGMTKRSISEEQYIKIFAPIDKLLYFDCYSELEKYNIITKIISDNYYIVPENIRISYSSIGRNFEGLNDFEYDVLTCFKYLSSTLGYSREKLSKKEIKTAKRILNRKSNDVIISKYSFLLVLALISILTLIITHIVMNYTNIKITPLIITLIVIISEILMITVFVISSFILSKVSKKQ